MGQGVHNRVDNLSHRGQTRSRFGSAESDTSDSSWRKPHLRVAAQQDGVCLRKVGQAAKRVLPGDVVGAQVWGG